MTDIIETLHRNGGNIGKTARELGRNERSLRRNKKVQEYKELVANAPDGHAIKGVSTLYDNEGNIKQQWIKTLANDAESKLQAAFDGMGDKLPRVKPQKPPKHSDSDLLSCYVITDYHLGMLSWGEETGADWDTDIAEQLLVDWFAAAIRMAPASERAIFAQLGDFLHWDGMDAVTPASKHLLDADTRFQKLVRVAIRVVRRVIDLLLAKHTNVHVLMAEGNHDPASSIWLREWLSAVYENEPRVTVDVSPDPYYCVEHGKTAVFFHHGHKRRMTNIDTVFAAKFRETFGRTKHAYAHMGHLHHIEVKETNLMVIEQHRTLAAPDAYASRGGWMSGREAKVVTYSKQYGEVSRLSVTPEMLRGAA